MDALEELKKKIDELFSEHNYKEIIELLTDEVLKIYNYDSLYLDKGQAYDFLAEDEEREKNYANAIELYQKAIEVNSYSYLAYKYLGDVYCKIEFFDLSIINLKRAVEIDPDYYFAYTSLGKVYIETKNYNRAVKALKQAIDIKPNLYFAFDYLGDVYSRKEEFKKAIRSYERVIEIDSDHYYAYDKLGNAYSDIGEFGKEVKIRKKAIKLKPNDYYAYSSLGYAYKNLGEFQKAIKAFEKAIEIKPDYPGAHNSLGNIYVETREFDRAEKACLKAIKIEPDYYMAYDTLGVTYVKNNNFDKAIEAFKSSININANNELTYFFLGMLHEKKKDHKAAINYYNKSISNQTSDNVFFLATAHKSVEELSELVKNPELEKVKNIIQDIKALLSYQNESIVHYTSLDVSRNLILNEKPFRLSEGAYLNDTAEGRVLYKFLDLTPTSHHPDNTIVEPFVKKPFIGSFVPANKNDDLTLWRVYGKENHHEASGCALTISTDFLTKSIYEYLIINDKQQYSIYLDEFVFYRVAYMEDETKAKFIIPGLSPKEAKKLSKHVTDLKNELKINKELLLTHKTFITNMLNEIAFLFKNAAYQHEHEIRLITSGTGIPKNITSENGIPRVYIELAPIVKSLQKITLGPKVERAEEWAATFYYHYDNSDRKPEILLSHLPFK